jgi:hypothetical protein
MGDIIGGLIGGIGALTGGSAASKQAMTGYNYLTGSNGVGSVVNNGTNANNAENALLTGTGTPAQNQAFGNYANSTGYNFQKQQGDASITGSAAARGILNSGAQAKALTSYGSNLASTTFNNYLSQLQGVSGQGLTASGQIGQAGTQGGANAAQVTAGGINGAAGSIAGIAGPLMNFMGV